MGCLQAVQPSQLTPSGSPPAHHSQLPSGNPPVSYPHPPASHPPSSTKGPQVALSPLVSCVQAGSSDVGRQVAICLHACCCWWSDLADPDSKPHSPLSLCNISPASDSLTSAHLQVTWPTPSPFALVLIEQQIFCQGRHPCAYHPPTHPRPFAPDPKSSV